jgi:hypothetical protein
MLILWHSEEVPFACFALITHLFASMQILDDSSKQEHVEAHNGEILKEIVSLL